MMKLFVVLLIAAVIISCSDNKPPRGVLKPDVMEKVLWDYINADAFTTDFISRDSSKHLPAENAKLQKAVFAKYKISKETFYKSYYYYESNPEQLRILLDTMISRNRRLPADTATRRDSSRRRDTSRLQKL